MVMYGGHIFAFFLGLVAALGLVILDLFFCWVLAGVAEVALNAGVGGVWLQL